MWEFMTTKWPFEASFTFSWWYHTYVLVNLIVSTLYWKGLKWILRCGFVRSILKINDILQNSSLAFISPIVLYYHLECGRLDSEVCVETIKKWCNLIFLIFRILVHNCMFEIKTIQGTTSSAFLILNLTI